MTLQCLEAAGSALAPSEPVRKTYSVRCLRTLQLGADSHRISEDTSRACITHGSRVPAFGASAGEPPSANADVARRKILRALLHGDHFRVFAQDGQTPV